MVLLQAAMWTGSLLRAGLSQPWWELFLCAWLRTRLAAAQLRAFNGTVSLFPASGAAKAAASSYGRNMNYVSIYISANQNVQNTTLVFTK